MMARLIMPLVIGLLGTGILVALGLWQTQRLSWKEGVLAEIEARMAAAPIALPQEPDETAHRFRPVALEGELAGAPIYIFTSGQGQGARLRMIQPFETGGRRILLERGLVAPGATDGLPTSGALVVEGMLHWPDEADSFTPPPDPGTGVRYARVLSELADLARTEPVLVVTRTSAPPEPRIVPHPLDPSGIPNNHLQYAVTWFGLALVWAAMTGYWIRRLARAEK